MIEALDATSAEAPDLMRRPTSRVPRGPCVDCGKRTPAVDLVHGLCPLCRAELRSIAAARALTRTFLAPTQPGAAWP